MPFVFKASCLSNFLQFAGTWYQIERYPYPQVSNEGTCVGTRYTQSNNGLNVLNWEVIDGTLNTIEGSATVDEATATLNVNLPQEGDAGKNTNGTKGIFGLFNNRRKYFIGKHTLIMVLSDLRTQYFVPMSHCESF